MTYRYRSMQGDCGAVFYFLLSFSAPLTSAR